MRRLFLNDKFILALILVNTVCIFIDGFEEITQPVKEIAGWIDYGITILFIVEMSVKMAAWGVKGYLASNWNRLDFVLVILSLSSLALPFTDGANVDLGFLLAFRVSRIFKFFRFLRFVDGIDQMIRGVKRAVHASVVVLLGFFIFTVVCALISNHLLRELSPEYFGNPIKSMYAIFRIFTIEGWYEIPDSVVENSSMMIKFVVQLYFIILLTTGGLFGFSIVNSIFVDAMVADNNDDLEKKIDQLTSEVQSLRKLLLSGRHDK